MNIQVRPIATRDLLSATKLIQKTIRISQGKLYPEHLVEAFCAKYTVEEVSQRLKTMTYFIAENEDKKIVGIIGLKENHLRTFFVDPDFQGKGIGRLLYNRLEEEARGRNIKELFLEGSPLGKPVYERFGFHALRTITKNRNGVMYKDTFMSKQL